MAKQTINNEQQVGTTLGYAQITSSFSTTNTSATAVTGLSVTITVPSGGRRVKITAWTKGLVATGASNCYISIWDGTVGSGTQLALSEFYNTTANGPASMTCIAVVTPSAGSKTYNAGLHGTSASTKTMEAAATYPAFILAELI